MSTSSSPDDSSSSSPLILRLHLIRHGETESNHSKLVLGQADSPLTPRGISQACATGKYLSCKQQTEGFAYWKMASSDLKRCRDTTDHILNAMAMNEKRKDYDATAKKALEEIVVDERLRERAKGVREGRPKSLSTEEAMKEHKAEEKAEGVSKPIPKFETEEEVWIRMHDFVKSTLQEAMENHCTTNAAQQQQQQRSEQKPVIYHALIVSHSAMLRISLNRIYDEHWLVPECGDQGNNGIYSDMLIPNTSITLVDVVPKAVVAATAAKPSTLEEGWSVINLDLPSTTHLNDVAI